jgi:hypothetical protein
MTYFAASIFLSAFLLFQVEPMIAKFILPWFGGTPAVWSTVVLFFQVLLTGGYAYASWLSARPRRRELVHIVLLGLSILLMAFLAFEWKSPITPADSLKPAPSSSPVLEIFKLLLVSVGLPYFLLASNSPLIQAWFNRAFPGKTAYRLYSLSNAASLLALITYPVLVEPNLTLPLQGWTWSLMYLVYAGLAAYGAFRSLRGSVLPEVAAGKSSVAESTPRPTRTNQLLWVGLAATASILLLATTSHLTQEVAVIPFLWVLPLTIYLLTFVLAFSGERWYSRQVYLILLFVGTLLATWAEGQSAALAIPWQIAIYSLELFAACMVCHGELYRLRPEPARLTWFYVMVSVGGAVGGLVINFVAPYVFKGFWEMPLGIVLCWLMVMLVVLRSSRSAGPHWRSILNSVIILSAFLIAGVRAYEQIRADLSRDLLIERNFYGVVRVEELGTQGTSTDRYAMVSGVTIHGYQFMSPAEHDLPTSYFTPSGGGGLAILNSPRRGKDMRVGILGLGIGTLAAYGEPGDVYRFYEINPQVVSLAEGQGGYFSYLADSKARTEIVLGDARLSLEQELAQGQLQNYDVLILDVFTSDSIPTHLLDEQAFELYLKQLAPEGILAVHISNLHLNLVPVVWTLADHFHLARVLISDPGNGLVAFPSLWFLLARDPALLQDPAIASRAVPMAGYTSHVRMWTDDFSDLFQILK